MLPFRKPHIRHQPLTWVIDPPTFGMRTPRVSIAKHIGGSWENIPAADNAWTAEEIITQLKGLRLIHTHAPRYPDVIIGPSAFIPYMLTLKEKSGGKSMVVALRSPVHDVSLEANAKQLRQVDLVVSYPHLSGNEAISPKQLLLCDAIPNHITARKIHESKAKWGKEFLPALRDGPRIGVIIGGPVNSALPFTPAVGKELGKKINAMAAAEHGSVLMTTSRRTPDDTAAAIRAEITAPCYFHQPHLNPSENPYLGMLGFADHIITTGDSLSMCSEAIATGKPVHIFQHDPIIPANHKAFAQNLVQKGYARYLGEEERLPSFQYEPYNSANVIADAIKDKLTDRHVKRHQTMVR